MSNLKIAVQKSGRLKDNSLKLLKDIGISIDNGKEQLKARATNFPIEVFYLRNGDIPQYLRGNQLPSFETNCIEEWEEKLDKIVTETLGKDLSLIGGIPPWVQMYFDRIVEITGKPVIEIFPNLQVLVQGGVNFEPYKTKLFDTIGKQIDTIELFPASEGFFAYQDTRTEPGLLLNTNSGIFYEFIPLANVHDEAPIRISLADVQLGEQYAMVINSNAGLWGYHLGDTIKFVSIDPYRVIVTGRVKHFISAFGEHVIGKEVEKALNDAISGTKINVSEFTVAPQVNPSEGLPYHEWFVEFENEPEDMDDFASKIDASMQAQNVYYFDLIEGKILQPLLIRKVKKGGFHEYMKSIGKFGGQNKIPQLSDNRKIADVLQNFLKD